MGWNGKLKCIEDVCVGRVELIKDKIYEVKNGRVNYGSEFIGNVYDSFEDYITHNKILGKYFIEIEKVKEKSMPQWNIESNKLATYITINDTVTIAIPNEVPIGISKKHPEDEYNKEIGEALALKRMLEKF